MKTNAWVIIEKYTPVTLLPKAKAEKINASKPGTKMTIKHEEIKELSMPPMTMFFRLKDPMWTVQFKVGDPIQFRVIDLGSGRLQVIELERKQ